MEDEVGVDDWRASKAAQNALFWKSVEIMAATNIDKKKKDLTRQVRELEDKKKAMIKHLHE